MHHWFQQRWKGKSMFVHKIDPKIPIQTIVHVMLEKKKNKVGRSTLLKTITDLTFTTFRQVKHQSAIKSKCTASKKFQFQERHEIRSSQNTGLCNSKPHFDLSRQSRRYKFQFRVNLLTID